MSLSSVFPPGTSALPSPAVGAHSPVGRRRGHAAATSCGQPCVWSGSGAGKAPRSPGPSPVVRDSFLEDVAYTGSHMSFPTFRPTNFQSLLCHRAVPRDEGIRTHQHGNLSATGRGRDGAGGRVPHRAALSGIWKQFSPEHTGWCCQPGQNSFYSCPSSGARRPCGVAERAPPSGTRAQDGSSTHPASVSPSHLAWWRDDVRDSHSESSAGAGGVALEKGWVGGRTQFPAVTGHLAPPAA